MICACQIFGHEPEESSSNNFDRSEVVQGTSVSPNAVCLRLRNNITFWKNIDVGTWVLRIISNGFCPPFYSLPMRKFMKNTQIAL